VRPDTALTAAVADLREVVRDLRSVVETLRPASPGVDVDLLSFDQVAGAIGVSPRTLRRLRARRGFPRPLGGPGPLRWRKRSIESWLEARK
jgi:predicted DNA-binding transcriptional regulator AlpA